MNNQPRIEDISQGAIDNALETDRFEQWYCWVRNFDLVEWREKQAELKANNRKDNVVHHCRCTWLNAKRDMMNQRAAFMAAHDTLVTACEELGKNQCAGFSMYDEWIEIIFKALAAVKEASDERHS